MTIDDIVGLGGTFVFDPSETSISPDDFLAKYGNTIDTICIVAKSEYGSAYYSSGTAPKDPRFGEVFPSLSQIATDIGIQTFAMIYGNKDAFFSRDPNFLMYRSGGNPIENYVCPNQEAYWRYLGEIGAEIAKNTQVDGIIIKDFHYPNHLACFCENCKRKFVANYNYNRRDFTYQQIKQDNKLDEWQEFREFSLKQFNQNFVNRVHTERKIEIIPEIIIDPLTDYFKGAKSETAQNLVNLAQITPHILLHIYPWTDFPTDETEINILYDNLSEYYNKLSLINTSLFVWNPNLNEFMIAKQVKDSLNSNYLFFTDYKPSSYLNRRSIHLELGV